MSTAAKPSSGPSPPAASSGRPDKFEETQFLRDLVNLRDTQEAIQGLSTWCIRNRRHAYKISRCWLKVARKVKAADQKITLFHLINDVVQHAKRKRIAEVLDKCQAVLKEAMTHFRQPEKVAAKVKRCLDIWEERQVFEAAFVQELRVALDDDGSKRASSASGGPASTAETTVMENFQPQQLCTQLKIMKALEDDTDYKLKTVREAEPALLDVDMEQIRQENLKDRQHGNDFIGDFEEGRKKMEQYVKAVEKEIAKRRQVIELLAQGRKYYESLNDEAEIVATAYSNFGKRVKLLRGKLESKMPALEQRQQNMESISPVPSPPPADYDAPSPQAADEMELELPDEGHAAAPIVVYDQANPVSGGGGDDLNSRLDSFIKTMKDGGGKDGGRRQQQQSLSRAPSSGGNQVSISEFLTKLATGEDSGSTATHQYGSAPSGYSQPPPPLPPSSHQPPPSSAATALPHHDDWYATNDWQQQPWPQPRRDGEAPPPPPSTATATGDQTPTEAEEPVPEWQLAPVDEEPPDVHEYSQNVALARLSAKNSSSISNTDESADNLISLTNESGRGAPVKARNFSGGRRSDDMELSDGGGDDYGNNGQYQKPPHQMHSHPPPSSAGPSPSHFSQPPPPFRQQQQSSNGAHHENSDGRPSLQDRLRSLAGQPASNDELMASKLGHFDAAAGGPSMDAPPPPMFNRGGPRPPYPRGGGGGFRGGGAGGGWRGGGFRGGARGRW